MKAFITAILVLTLVSYQNEITFSNSFEDDLKYFKVNPRNIELIMDNIQIALLKKYPDGGMVKVKGTQYSVKENGYNQQVMFGIEVKTSSGKHRYIVKFSGDGKKTVTFNLE